MRSNPQSSSRVRALPSHLAVRIPFELLPLAVAVMILFAAPAIASAAAGTDGATAPTGAAAPQAQDATFKPEIEGRVSDRSSTGHDGIHVRGRATHVGTGKTKVVLSARRAGHKRWFKVATTKVKPGKKFTIGWAGSRPGRFLTKLTVYKYGKSATDHLGAAFVFRSTFASYYGPGLYGGGLACGGTLKPSTIGVAHKTLPCGTKVTFKVGNHIVTAPVVDRGPYVSGRDWDLTAGLKRKLHFGSTGTVHSTS
ncbi:MAG: septal ring lytic transglycosylase RlpA family protein [Solirubrobacterales bacterium]